jgi:hypothetical protein
MSKHGPAFHVQELPLDWDGAGTRKACRAPLNVTVVVDFVGEASYSDSDRGHGNNEPKHERSPPKFGIRNNRDTEGDYADRDQICR